MPMFGVTRLTLEEDCESIRGDDDFFSVARTMPFVAGSSQNCSFSVFVALCIPLIPNEVTPWLTALRAYSAYALVVARLPLQINRQNLLTDLYQLPAVTR